MLSLKAGMPVGWEVFDISDWSCYH
jgi:hypothetical protein